MGKEKRRGKEREKPLTSYTVKQVSLNGRALGDESFGLRHRCAPPDPVGAV
jgi:hypothetical protein